VVESPFAAVRHRTAAVQAIQEGGNATAVIWKARLRRTRAPPEVAKGIISVDGVRAKRGLDSRHRRFRYRGDPEPATLLLAQLFVDELDDAVDGPFDRG
jgi:hypothetical protein